MSERLYYEDLQVGDRWVSPTRTITEADVVNFAGMTGDFNPLHVDREYAAGTPFRQPIAHGLLGLSWVAGLGSESPAVETMAFTSISKWEFVRPAFIGDTVHVVTKVDAKQESGRRCGQVTWLRQLVNQDNIPIQTGEFTTLVCTRAAADRKTRRDKAESEPQPGPKLHDAKLKKAE
ncbi:MAG: MaoC/PaaZ C-terminal domain-containing protein [Pirellulaceae bacterium]|jgi:acyl dehydratase|nr:MaoC/PaaZ C-terminal domain-containing protein [Pirellulaceae bacterium]MDP7014536.1 MaoC/PaaZ C-terminal domain-containing protein [Pirellulaceae bacterium]